MKKIFKKMPTVIIMLGLVISISACTTNSDSQKKSTSFAEKNYAIDAKKIEQISLSAKGRTVEVIESTDKKIHIKYFENDKEFYEVHVTNKNELAMKLVTNKNWKDYVGLNTEKAHRIVQLAVPNGISSGIKIRTSKGNITLSDVKLDGAVEAITSDGMIEITDTKVNKHLKLETKNDDLVLSGVSAKNSIDATSSNGDIKVKKVAVEDALKLTTKNGDITGTIIGSYDAFSISSNASKGKNNLPENKKNGDTKLNVTTNNGDIHLELVE